MPAQPERQAAPPPRDRQAAPPQRQAAPPQRPPQLINPTTQHQIQPLPCPRGFAQIGETFYGGTKCAPASRRSVVAGGQPPQPRPGSGGSPPLGNDGVPQVVLPAERFGADRFGMGAADIESAKANVERAKANLQAIGAWLEQASETHELIMIVKGVLPPLQTQLENLGITGASGTLPYQEDLGGSAPPTPTMPALPATPPLPTPAATPPTAPQVAMPQVNAPQVNSPPVNTPPVNTPAPPANIQPPEITRPGATAPPSGVSDDVDRSTTSGLPGTNPPAPTVTTPPSPKAATPPVTPAPHVTTLRGAPPQTPPVTTPQANTPQVNTPQLNAPQVNSPPNIRPPNVQHGTTTPPIPPAPQQIATANQPTAAQAGGSGTNGPAAPVTAVAPSSDGDSIPSLLEVPVDAIEPGRSQLQGEHRVLQKSYSMLQQEGQAFNAQCAAVLKRSSTDAECWRRYKELNDERVAYSSYVNDFNARVRAMPRSHKPVLMTPEEAEPYVGMLGKHIAKLAAFCNRNQYLIVFRASNPASMKFYEDDKYVAKPSTPPNTKSPADKEIAEIAKLHTQPQGKQYWDWSSTRRVHRCRWMAS